MSSGWYILLYVLFYWKHYLINDMFFLRVCIIGGHVLLLVLFHWNTCFAGWYVLEEVIYYMRACLAAGLSSWSTCGMSGHAL